MLTNVDTLLDISYFFFFNHTATPEIYTLSLHDALPISASAAQEGRVAPLQDDTSEGIVLQRRSEEHTSELQSHSDLVCRLLLEKKKTNDRRRSTTRASGLHGSARGARLPGAHVAPSAPP